MEERLKRSGGQAPAATGSPRGQRQPLANTFGQAQPPQANKDSSQRPLQASRPGTAKQTQHAPAHGGAMPPTPTASEGEYENDGVETRSFADFVLVSKDGGDRDS
jgi:hypothetical protein